MKQSKRTAERSFTEVAIYCIQMLVSAGEILCYGEQEEV